MSVATQIGPVGDLQRGIEHARLPERHVPLCGSAVSWITDKLFYALDRLHVTSGERSSRRLGQRTLDSSFYKTTIFE